MNNDTSDVFNNYLVELIIKSALTFKSSFRKPNTIAILSFGGH